MDFGLLTLEMRGINTVFKIQATETCNTVMEEKFCDNMQSVRFWGFDHNKRLQSSLIKIWQILLMPTQNYLAILRPIWP